jgi:hypothetical protein
VTNTDKIGFSETAETGFLFDKFDLTVSFEESIAIAVGSTSTTSKQQSYSITCKEGDAWDVYSAYATGNTELGDTIEGVPDNVGFICVAAGQPPPTCPPGCCTNGMCSPPCNFEGQPCLEQ